MKIIEAIRIIQQHEMRQVTSTDKPRHLIHVQTVLPQEDLFALRKKTGESSNKEAISKAIYHYLKFQERTR